MSNTKTISPYLFTILLLSIIGLVGFIPLENFLLSCSFSSFQAEYIHLLAKTSVLALLGYVLIKKWNLTVISGLSTKYAWKFSYLNLIPAYLMLLGIASVLSADFTNIELPNVILLLLSFLGVGFFEEFLFRGVLQSLFLKKYSSLKSGIFLGTFIPAFAFGLFHLVNISPDEPIVPVLIQVIFATLIGFFFGVLLLKTNKLMPLVITHALINFFFSLQFLPNFKSEVAEEPASITSIIICLPLFIIALFLLKKIDKTEVQEKLSQSF
ncbi:CPBP family intramembrane metalloprotease [Kordia sp. YSTF-M3]|uniref:CPBP family intramembrane metalloprotease n=1 Tax=Kordia aestuariivivens TaxID=2759037 RepID=A0ABR7QCT6_9FLAO|nr:CPBP family intramembrane glutamic endopeptidase [Kordia aestuariivivens]MBC8756376.1 CPBP family intramembrane metalloprotease [Kordia aestuariivivens]